MNRKDLAILSVSTAFLSSVIMFICLDITNGNFDNLADWFGALGSIGAILAVIYQVHKQREEFLEANKVEGTVYYEIELKKKVKNNIESYYGERVLVIYLINTGRRIEGFRFLGYASQQVLNSLINDNVGYDKLKNFGFSALFDEDYGKVESLQPSESSKKYKAEIELILSEFKKDKIIYPVYINTHGEFYYTKIVIRQ
ncbi:hypothetical protein GTO84_09385 (plasmid) [Ligilactobacillus salivarius]|uniref:hypothetical protein n=1 Tax=Ligilactobacillus salivarius TaxID=1624 RepID=UPI0011C87E99|nr:hypothetical protein [Ligilactobacillus salivarius]MBX0284422.1 hypothetical protein [Ligilactobacillus salivarius]QLL72788.1 hypothetical protein GTO84_09385 [Ligilactobacillus salivarius]TXJ79784.1 hypothetical protein FGO86_08750 [Ligilactobacillus salivarius]